MYQKFQIIHTSNSFLDGWTTDDLQYLWKTVDPVQIVPDLHLPRFTLEKYISDYCNIKTNTGKNAEIHLSPFFVRTYTVSHFILYSSVTRKKLGKCATIF